LGFALLKLIWLLLFAVVLLSAVSTIAVGVAPRFLAERANDAEIVLGVLKVAFGQNPVAILRRVARQVEIFLMHLIRVTSDPNVGTVAIESLIAVRSSGAAVVITATTPPTFVVWTLSHL
jgi:hypothetical protein